MRISFTLAAIAIITSLSAQEPEKEISIFSETATVNDMAPISGFIVKNCISVNIASLFRGFTTINYERRIKGKYFMSFGFGPSYQNYVDQIISEEYSGSPKYSNYSILEVERPGVAVQIMAKINFKSDVFNTNYIAFDMLSYTNIMKGNTYSNPNTFHNIRWRNTEVRTLFGHTFFILESDFVTSVYVYGGLKISSYPYLEQDYNSVGESFFTMTDYKNHDFGATVGIGLTVGYCF